VIDQSSCVAQGDCEELAPEAFRLDGDVSTVIGTAPQERLLAAARACPTEAITLINEDTGEQIYP
jgi:ferredoxin